MRQYVAILFAVMILVVPWFSSKYPEGRDHIIGHIMDAESQIAAVIFHKAKTVAEIQKKYDEAGKYKRASKVKILVVPGHEPEIGGAEYSDLKERVMSVELARQLVGYLSMNDRYEVFMTRDEKDWYPIFKEYFDSNWENIVAWQKANKEEFSKLTNLGTYKSITPTVIHNDAPKNVAYRLYGISKWVNDNDIDIVIHVHFNDYPGHGIRPGKYKGFAIYVPEKQYFNSTTTKALAETVYRRLEKYNPVSNLPGESEGIVEDQDLIAVGSYNSVNAPSMLVEYGYIYEPQFTDPNLRSKAINDLAFQTYVGLQDFFDPNNVTNFGQSYDTVILPTAWQTPFSTDDSGSVLALQTALLLDGVYPPFERSKQDCPRTGTLGPCTKTALQSFQRKYGIAGEKGIVGPKTIEVLNSLYINRR